MHENTRLYTSSYKCVTLHLDATFALKLLNGIAWA